MAEAAIPSESGKRHWLGQLQDPENNLSLARRRAAMGGLFPAHQPDLHAAFADDIIDSLDEVGRRHEDAFLVSYGRLIPVLCRQESVERLAAAIEKSAAINPNLFKALRIAHQEDARCLAINERLEAHAR